MDKHPLLEKLEKIHNLPTLPAIIERLGQAVRDPRSDARKIARIIEDDPSMMARILKIVNSAFYGVSEPIHSVQHAVARMGLTAVNNIAMSTSVFSTFNRKGETDFDREAFWRHAISSGIACNVLYRHCQAHLRTRPTKDLLHLAGLLHDIGKIVLEQFFHADFIRAIQAARATPQPLFRAETEVLGIDHAVIGAWLGQRWNISAEVVAAIRHHHDPTQTDPTTDDLVHLVHLANYICNLEKIGDSGDAAAPAFVAAAWNHLGLNVSDIAGLVDEVREEAKHSEILLAFLGSDS